ncbi:Putative amidase C550.07 [Saitozyma sp. JCM 24511]|nr:Putative amidase C550.07 [Saitozyma sp. JCM 24511]
MMTPAECEEKAGHYRSRRDALITEEYRVSVPSEVLNVSNTYQTCGLLSPREVEIVELDATALAQAIASRAYTAVEVILAYNKSTAVAQQTVNCLTWFMPQEALARAQWLDDQLEQTGRPVGILHGVPISVKDFIMVKNAPQSSGFVSRAGSIPTEDADIVSILRAEGAVFHAKTNNPQSIMQLETVSFMDVTTNPHNRNLTSGGSSGGDAALVASHGAPLGITTDIGGSTRVPAANCGLFGFKPSSSRLPKGGLRGVMPGDGIAGSIGPVARSRRDLELFLRAVLHGRPWEDDVSIPPLPWRPAGSNGVGAQSLGWSGTQGRLRIGVMMEDGIVRPLIPVRQALEDLVQRLRSSPTVELIEIQPISHQDHWNLIMQLYYLDGAKKLREALDGEPMLPLTEWIADQAKEQDVHGTWRLACEKDAFRARFMADIKDRRIDVVLCPAGPGPAPLHGTSKYWGYTSLFNLLDWPAAVFPNGISVNGAMSTRSSFTVCTHQTSS